MKIIRTEKAPSAIGPYSQAVAVKNMLYTSGQLGINPETGALQNEIADQARQCLKNLNEILIAAEFEKSHIVKTTIFLKHMDDFDTVNKIYEEFFSDHKPARSTVEVSKLPKAALIEIEATAIK